MENEELNNQPEVKSNKDLMMERLQGMHPDMDEESMYGEHLKHMDNMDRASKAHAELGEKLTAHPRVALMLADVMDGTHPKVAMARYFNSNEEEGESEPEDMEAQILEAEKLRLAEEQETKAMKAEFEQNLANSSADIQAFKESKNLTDEQFGEFIETCVEMEADLLAGKLNTQLLNVLWNGKNYESDMKNETSLAEERGRISERNAKIEAQKKRMAGDGLPATPTSNGKSKNLEMPSRTSAWDTKYKG